MRAGDGQRHFANYDVDVICWVQPTCEGVRGGGRWSRGRIGQDAAGTAKALKHARFALWKNPENLTTRQAAKLTWIAKTDPTLHRAYLLKEGLRLVFQLGYDQAVEALEAWIGWGAPLPHPHLRRPAAPHRKKHKPSILAAIEHGMSNGRIESVNTKIRLITRVAFGFQSPDALIALTSADTDPSSHAGNDLRISHESQKEATASGRAVPVISIAYGPDSDVKALRSISNATGGAVYTARNPRDLPVIFRDAVGHRGCDGAC